VSFNDPDIRASYDSFDSPAGHGTGAGYLVTPRDQSGDLPTVLVVHENRGLDPYVEDVARRLAKSGYPAFAPDALFPLGGYPGNDDEGKAMQKSMDKSKLQNDFVAVASF
jgi:carboxymethylenebutenolidase